MFPRSPAILSLLVLFTSIHESISQVVTAIDESSCEKTKSCFKLPEGILVTYKPSGNNEITMELAGGKNPKYVAVGFSKDDKMGEDYVVWCTDGGVVGTGINPGGKSPTTAENTANLATKIEAAVLNGELICRFKVKLGPINIATLPFNSLNASLHLLLASGSGLNGEAPAFHDLIHGPSKTPFELGSTKFTSAKAKPGLLSQKTKSNLKQAHGSLMIFGWMFCMATAILMARYFKPMWPETKIIKKPVWFLAHQSLNVFGITCTLVAFICIFVAEEGKWEGPAPSEIGNGKWTQDNGKVHSLLGLICSILGFLQPLNALFRCHPGTPKRPIFNWVHRIIGFMAWIFSAATIFYSTRFGYFTDSGNDPQCWLIFYWVVVGLVILALEIHVTLTERIKSSVGNQDYPMNPVNGMKDPSHPEPDPVKRIKWALARTVVLIGFVVLAVMVVIALITYINT